MLLEIIGVAALWATVLVVWLYTREVRKQTAIFREQLEIRIEERADAYEARVEARLEELFRRKQGQAERLMQMPNPFLGGGVRPQDLPPLNQDDDE